MGLPPDRSIINQSINSRKVNKNNKKLCYCIINIRNKKVCFIRFCLLIYCTCNCLEVVLNPFGILSLEQNRPGYCNIPITGSSSIIIQNLSTNSRRIPKFLLLLINYENKCHRVAIKYLYKLNNILKSSVGFQMWVFYISNLFLNSMTRSVKNYNTQIIFSAHILHQVKEIRLP